MFITFLVKGRYVFGSVGLSVCLFVNVQHYSKRLLNLLKADCNEILWRGLGW